ncbi:MAG: hypothetical protein U1E21_05870 [Reyranellaceae bacterium]
MAIDDARARFPANWLTYRMGQLESEQRWRKPVVMSTAETEYFERPCMLFCTPFGGRTMLCK